MAYTTRTQTSPITGVSAIQAGTDSGGTYQQVSEGVIPTFATAFPADYDKTVTHTVAMYGSPKSEASLISVLNTTTWIILGYLTAVRSR